MLPSEIKELKPSLWVINIVSLFNGVVGPCIASVMVGGYFFFMYYVFSSDRIDLNNSTVSGLVFSIISGVVGIVGVISGYYFSKNEKNKTNIENTKFIDRESKES